MSVKQNAPKVRFDKGGPYAHAGVSFVPKVVTFKKKGISGTANHDFFIMPAGTLLTRAFLRCDKVVDEGTVTLGTSGGADSIINATDFSGETVGNSKLFNTGVYFHNGATIRLASAGTATEGDVSGFLEYYEVPSMLNDITHFDI